MNKKNYITVFLTVIIASSLIIAGAYAYRQFDRSEKTKNSHNGEELIGGQKDDRGCLIAAGYSWCEAEQKCFRPWEETCGVDPAEEDLESIKKAFMDKYQKSADEIQVYVSQFDGNFARGGVKFSMNGEFGEGGIFLACKEKDAWKLAFDGNGMYACEAMEKYDFPPAMIPDCYQRQTADPLETTRAFYAEWMAYAGNPITDKLYQNHALLSEDYERKIQETIDGFEFGGFDPVLMAQDKPQNLDFSLSRESGNTAIVDVTQDFGTSVRILKVDLFQEDGRWLIGNIRDAEKPDSQLLADNTELQKKVGDYIRDNISGLSPEKAVLGGTFYVTKIKFEDGNKAKVEYEDGHIAFQAEALYEILPDGSVRIDKFIIAEDYRN